MSPTFIATFSGVLPPARFDAQPWTKILINEAKVELPSGEGTFETIDTISISALPGGVDGNPAEPAYRDITIQNATVAEGWYEFQFEDEEGHVSAPKAIKNGPTVEGGIRPSLEDLGALLHVRTVVPGSGGNELGTFTSATRPTASETERLLQNAVNQVLLTTGPNLKESFWAQSKTVILYLTAMLVELSFYKNEITKSISAYPEYKELYEEALQGLIDSINSDTAASPTQSFFTVPVQTKNQAHFAALMAARDPVTGLIDPMKLPPDMAWPLGLGGLPITFDFAVNALGLHGFLPGDSFLAEY